jgi:hypothetical protein
MKFPGRQDQQQPFSDRLRCFALRTVKLGGGKVSELLRHAANLDHDNPRRNASGCVFVFVLDFLNFSERNHHFL